METAKKTKSSVVVMVNGLPGNMGHEVSNACLRRGFELAPLALTGPNQPAEVQVGEEDGSKATVALLGPDAGDADERITALAAKCKEEGKTLVAIDFTLPSAVNANAETYARLKLPFVMGTTGGDRDKLLADTQGAGIYAVIAPNMCKQIVALQAMMDHMATEFPGAFGGYELSVTESHQNGKADTSGTAKAMVKYFNKLKGGEEYDVESITKLREPEEQKKFGVPEDALRGHAWHTYSLKSNDGSVEFQFKHNVCGRRTYAEGVADAVSFLASKIHAEADKKIYNMIDVLREGGMA